jgi:xanthine dehydrogenase small subunit
MVDGRQVQVPDDGGSLLDVLRDGLGLRSAKDGCSPQGQCGCCTVLVDGAPRVACVTPARRVADREITTLDGLPVEVQDQWADALVATGGSQCGFCTPGIIVRLEGLRTKGVGPDDTTSVERALQAHLCRCTGWRTILEAYAVVADDRSTISSTTSRSSASRDFAAAGRRATLEGGAPQRVGPDVALGRAGFAADTVPDGALVAVPDGAGGWVVGETLAEARQRSGKVQGRRTTFESAPPIDLPAGDWAVTLRTSWVEPGYLETDAAWCEPGGEPSSPLANGGAFGGKVTSMAPAAAAELAGRLGRSVLVVLSREDVVRMGPKRPPMAAGVRADGSGVIRVARTPGIVERIGLLAPGIEVIEVDVAGPPTSVSARAAGWAEAAVLLAAATSRGPTGSPAPAIEVRSPAGGWASASVDGDGTVRVNVAAGDPLDEVVLRSYAVGAAHMAIGWVTSEALAVDAAGVVHDLTIRSFGVLRAIDTPPIEIDVDPAPGEPVNGSDAVFAAVAAAVWRHQGFVTQWPTGIALRV